MPQQSMQAKTLKELFIVEGKSAASTLQQALHKPTQSVHALQGKLINAEKASRQKILANLECQKLFQVLASGIGKHCNPHQLAFSRVIILGDPDIDGAHARALLLILFSRYLQALLDAGLVYTITPPLYRITEVEPAQKQYVWSQAELDKFMNKQKERDKRVVTRFKGIAQFSNTECSQLFLDPKTRQQLQISSASLPRSAEAP